MKAKLLMDIQETEAVTYINFSGGITEDNNLPTLGKYKPILLVHTKEIESVNSCGIRDWLDWIGTRNEQLYFFECSVPFMMQVNLVNHFLGQGIILSFFAPYYCPSCDDELQHLITIEEALTSSYINPVCADCNEEMELDVLPEVYFKFLTSMTMPSISAELRQLVQRFSSQ